MERKLLEILERNSRISVEQLAAVLEVSEAEVAELMAKFEQDRVILGYHTVVDWEKANRDLVTALIEIKVTRWGLASTKSRRGFINILK